MADHFLTLDAASRDPERKVAWCTSVGPAELLHALRLRGLLPREPLRPCSAPPAWPPIYIPCGQRHRLLAGHLLLPDRRHRRLLRPRTPLTGAYGIESVPKPDVLVYNTNQCRDVKDWFSFYGRSLERAGAGRRDLPRRRRGDATSTSKASPVSSVPGPELEKVAGRSLDMAKLARSVALSRALLGAVEEGARHRRLSVPSPLTFFDGTIHMGPAVVLGGPSRRSTTTSCCSASSSSESTKGSPPSRARSTGSTGRDAHLGEAAPISRAVLAELDTCVVASTYCNSWIFKELDPREPFESMARAYTELFIVRSDRVKEHYIARCAPILQVDGICSTTPRPVPTTRTTATACPSGCASGSDPLRHLDGDLNDLRCYSEEQAKTKIEAFVEQLSEGR